MQAVIPLHDNASCITGRSTRNSLAGMFALECEGPIVYSKAALKSWSSGRVRRPARLSRLGPPEAVLLSDGVSRQ
jgi:hypothetical protein